MKGAIIDLAIPSTIRCGSESFRTLVKWLRQKRLKRVFFLVDPAVVVAIDKIKNELLQAHIEFFICTEVQPEPTSTNLEKLIQEARGFCPDVVVGIGGGSTMDLTKLLAIQATGELALSSLVGKDKCPGRGLSLIQVPTTAGTGSESTYRAIITDPGSGAKMAVESQELLADLVILDPDLTVSMPTSVTAATGMDALTHCIEAVTNVNAHPLTDFYALKGIELIVNNLPQALADGQDRVARLNLLLGATFGGFCLGPVNTAAVHAMAYPLGEKFHIAHGVANSLMLPYVLAFNVEKCIAQTAAIGRVLGFEGDDNCVAQYAVKAVKALASDVGIVTQIADLGIDKSAIPEMAKRAISIERLMNNNPRPMSYEDAVNVFNQAYGGDL